PPTTNTPSITITTTPLSCAGSYKVLIVYGQYTYSNNLRAALQADPEISQVELFNAGAGGGSTPTLARLLAYSLVVVHNNADYANAVALGDVLADYQDAGGLVFAF